MTKTRGKFRLIVSGINWGKKYNGRGRYALGKRVLMLFVRFICFFVEFKNKELSYCFGCGFVPDVGGSCGAMRLEVGFAALKSADAKIHYIPI